MHLNIPRVFGGGDVGHVVGSHVGHVVGSLVGHVVGSQVGHIVGSHVGHVVGSHVGHVVGSHVGHVVGSHVGHVVWPAFGGKTELILMCRWILHVPSILRVYSDDEEPKPTLVLAATCMYRIHVTLMSSIPLRYIFHRQVHGISLWFVKPGSLCYMSGLQVGSFKGATSMFMAWHVMLLKNVLRT